MGGGGGECVYVGERGGECVCVCGGGVNVCMCV